MGENSLSGAALPHPMRRLRGLLGDRPFDFLFIDGDHTYDGVRLDWNAYGKFVRHGGIIALHDVAAEYGSTQVKRLWDEIRDQGYNTHVYVERHGKSYGIGVVTVG